MDTCTTYYKEHVELNDDTPSTGDITCYDGVIVDADENKSYPSQSITISDCHARVRLHRGSYDSDEDWLKKVQKFHQAITRYMWHLEEKFKKDHPEG